MGDFTRETGKMWQNIDQRMVEKGYSSEPLGITWEKLHPIYNGKGLTRQNLLRVMDILESTNSEEEFIEKLEEAFPEE